MRDTQHVIGLTPDNIKFLMRGEPMMIDGEVMGIDDPVYVIYAESVEELQKRLDHLTAKPAVSREETAKPNLKIVRKKT